MIKRKHALSWLLAAAAFFGLQSVVADSIPLPGLSGPVSVYTDMEGIPTIAGDNELDVTRVQGFLHARDRLFQMDFLRRAASGTLAEMLGEAALSNDIQLRTLGLRRGAWATWAGLDNAEKAWMKAYADGVNFYLQNFPLPPEYGALQLTAAEPWSPVDSLVIGKLLAFQLSFDTGIVDNTVRLATYQGVGNVVGFDGTLLFFEDIFRIRPEDDRVTVPDFFQSTGIIPVPAAQSPQGQGSGVTAASPFANVPEIDPAVSASLAGWLDTIREVPILGQMAADSGERAGSNWWGISGEHTESGFPFLAHDPHLGLDMPPVFTKENLVIRDEGRAVSGVAFPGTPLVVLGCNLRICWGATVNRNDVTDYFQETVLVNNFGLPTHTVHNGQPEPILYGFQSYFANNIDDGEPDSISRLNVGYDAGAITFIIPRRNFGPVVAQPGPGQAVSVQYTGWGPTFELSTFRAWSRAENLEDFQAALSDFVVGSQNFLYADVEGNIAYFAGGAVPVRTDLQNNTVGGGIPPFLLRDGSGALGHDWLPVQNPQPGQYVPYEILPFNELPHSINPASGYLANGNNDPVGVTLDGNPLGQLRPGANGIYYLGYGYAPLRMGRIDREIEDMLASGEPLTIDDMKALQANTQMLDAELTVPYILEAFEHAASEGAWPGLAQFAADPGVQEAVARLAAWDFSSPTGLAEGFDPGKDPFAPTEPSEAEIAASVAATVYSVWRGQAIRNTIDATLSAVGLSGQLPGSAEAFRAFHNLLTSFPERQGVGASGLPFFNVEGAPDPATARDTVLLASLRGALDLLASEEFAPAFGESTDMNDYRWGRLHRIVFRHPLGVSPFNVPNGGGFSDLDEGLPGVARGGGFEVVDASGHSSRAASVNGFMFGAGAARRVVAEMTPEGPVAEEIIPGGRSGILVSPFYTNQLRRWLVNDYLPLTVGEEAAADTAIDLTVFGP